MIFTLHSPYTAKRKSVNKIGRLLFTLFLLINVISFVVAQNTTATIILTVDMSETEVSTEGVFVVGNFFNGFPEPLVDNGDGTWSYFGSFTKGDSLFYLFRNGQIDEVLKEGDCTTSDGKKRLLVVPNETETSIPKVCFNHCIICDEITTTTANFILSRVVFRLIPNPMQSHTYLCWENKEDIIINNIQLLDMKGRVLRVYKNITKPQLNIERGSLSKGAYLLKISDQKGRVVIQKLMVS